MNIVHISGNLARDAELRALEDGRKFAKFSIAVSRGKDKQADFFNCTAWEDLADIVEKFGVKGIRTVVEGKLQTNSYTNKDGITVRDVGIRVTSIEFMRGETEKPKKEAEDFVTVPDDVADEGLPFN